MSSNEESVWIPSYEKRDKYGFVESEEEKPLSLSENLVLGKRFLNFVTFERLIFGVHPTPSVPPNMIKFLNA